MENVAGSTIKGYELQERIGVGGFGAVYRAHQSTVGREVAIKVILPGYANDPEFIRRFETEAQLVARLEHLHITPLYDYWREPEGAYLVMRLMRGGSLTQALKNGPLDLETAALMIDQIASALAIAHRSSVIHRDIKPPNILLDEDGNAYLSDFGIAKELESAAVSLTEPDVVIGSPDYLAPEQTRAEPVTPQTDIYSLGIVLYEMLTGEHPFPDLSPVERLFKHINDPVPEISSLDLDLTDAINGVLQKATAKNPEHRYKDVLKLATDFREAAALSVSRAVDSLVELLTPREQEVLKCIIEGKSNREIAAELVVELGTVKWYIKQIYKKLNVRSRVQAIVRARELNLIVDGKDGPTLDTSTQLSLPEPENPYKGLRAFQVADEKDFFGREKLVEKMLNRLKEDGDLSRFLAIVGPSGSGKSSLVKAGLIPALWRGELSGADKWYIAEMIPGSHPLDELEVALVRVAAKQPKNLREQLQRDERGLIRVSKMILPDDNSQLLIVIDQFEEIFTLLEDEDKRAHFLDLIYTAVTDPRSRVRVVITLRADFYDRPLHYPEFGELIRNRMETVLPLSAEELERSIAQPVFRVGVKFEEGLVASIIDEMLYQPGALPLMQYALTELFEVREDRRLTHEGYQSIGGAVGALAKRAEEVFMEMDENSQEVVRQMYLRLVTLGEGVEDTRRRVSRSELLDISEDPDMMDEVIDTYANYRLLSLDNHPATRMPTVEVAHEAILREWERLREWLNEARGDIRLQRQLAGAVEGWQNADKDVSFLLHGSRLEKFEGWRGETDLALTIQEQEFLGACLAERDREQIEEIARQVREAALEKRSQNILGVLVGVFLVAAVVSGWLAVRATSLGRQAQDSAYAEATAAAKADQSAADEAAQRAIAEAAEQDALLQASIGLAAQSELELSGNHPERSVLLALEAVENYPYTWQAYRALNRAVYHSRLRMTFQQPSFINTLDISSDGSRVLTAGQDGRIRIIDSNTGEELLLIDIGKDSVNIALWSPDETKILASGFNAKAGWIKWEEGTIIGIWDSTTGEMIVEIPNDKQSFIIWSPDGSKIVTSRSDSKNSTNIAAVYDPETGEELFVLGGHSGVVRVTPESWSPDGDYLATASMDGTVKVWNTEDGTEIFTLTGSPAGILRAYFSPSGDRILTISLDNEIIVWDANTGEEFYSLQFEAAGGEALKVEWSPSGDRFAVAIYGGDAMIYDAYSGEMLDSFTGQVRLGKVSWSPDGSKIITTGEDGTAKIWDASGGFELITLFGHNSGVFYAYFMPDGQRVVTAGDDGSLRVWNTILAPMVTQGTPAFAWGWRGGGAWSPDDKYYARGYMDGTAIIWDAQTGEQFTQINDLGYFNRVADWSIDGRILVVNDIFEDLISIYDGESGDLTLSFEADHDPDSVFVVFNAQFSPDGTKIITNSWDSTARIFDAENGELIQILEGHEAAIWEADWSSDGSQVVTGGWDYTAKIWDVETGQVVRELYPEEYGHTIDGVAWSPDGSRIVTASADGLGWIWTLDGNEEPIILRGHSGGIYGFTWSPNGEFILSMSSDGTVRLWDSTTGVELMSYEITLDLEAYLSHDGTRIAVSVEDGSVRFYPALLPLADLIEYAYDCCVVRSLTPEERMKFGLPQVTEE